MLKLFSIIIFFLLGLYACTTQTSKQEEQNFRINNSGDTVIQDYRNDGSLLSEHTIRNGIKNGPAKIFYPSGNLKTAVYYNQDEKHGIEKRYYDDGSIHQETPYKGGKKDGTQKKYYRDGTLMAEIPYKQGSVIPGTKEYTSSGKLLDDYPYIRFYLDTLRKNHKNYMLKMLRSDSNPAITFYYYKKEGPGDSLKIGVPVRRHNGIGYIIFDTHNMEDIPERYTIYGEFKSERGTPVVLKRTWEKSADQAQYN